MYSAVISEQGQRAKMEDFYFLTEDFDGENIVFGGIYDGHGGKFASEYASRNLHRRFRDWANKGLKPCEAFINAYEKVSRELSHQTSGTTAVNFFIKDSIIYLANAGDSRAIIISKGSVLQLTVDHRVDNPEERKRIKVAGGIVDGVYVTRGNAGLMPTRTLGDVYFKAVGVIATPSVNEYHVKTDDLVFLAACDGLFDVISNEEIADIARKKSDIRLLLKMLKDEVMIKRSGSDNLTIIAIDLSVKR